MQVRKLDAVIVLAVLAFAVVLYAWIDGGREPVHRIVTDAAAPLNSRLPAR